MRAQLENARWNLAQTTVRAPANGTMVNVNLRPGAFVAGMPFNEVMTSVDTEYQVFALFNQNELDQVAAGNEAEITLGTYPGRIIKAHKVLQRQAIAEYAAVGLRAFGEVENARAAEIAAREREQIVTQALSDNQQALTVVQVQFRVGSTDLRFVEQRQLALGTTRSALIWMQAEQRVQRVNLHLAIGSSFEPRPAEPPPRVLSKPPSRLRADEYALWRTPEGARGRESVRV